MKPLFGFIQSKEEPCVYKKVSGSSLLFLILYVDDILLMGNDTSFMTDHDDKRSQSGYVYLLNGGAVSWRSWKQSTTADSTTAAEVMAVAEASKEGVWTKKFLEELGVVPSSSGPLELFCDNSASISQIKEPKSHHKTKYMDRKYFVTKDFIDEGKISLLWIDTQSNTADPLTKALSQAKGEMHFETMGLHDHGDWLED
jgi:hypothetical protein